MLPSFTRVEETTATWADEDNDNVTVGSKKKYSVSDNSYLYSNNQPLILKDERKLDFKKIEIRTPKLLSGVGMFWNRPLTVAEAEIFAESLRDLNEEVDLNENNKTNFWAALGVNKSTLTYKEAFETYMSEDFDVKVINKIANKNYSDSTETNKIVAFRNYISNTGHSCSPFR